MSKPKKKRDKKMSHRWSYPFQPAFLCRADSDRIEHSQNEAVGEKTLAHKQFGEMREGRGTYEVWCDLAARVNLGSVLARNHAFNEINPTTILNGGIEALDGVYKRAKKHGRYVLSGDEMRTLGDALELVDAMQDATTRRQHLLAMRAVIAEAAL